MNLERAPHTKYEPDLDGSRASLIAVCIIGEIWDCMTVIEGQMQGDPIITS